MAAVILRRAAWNGRVDALAAVARDHEGLAGELEGHLGLQGRLLAHHAVDLSPAFVLDDVASGLRLLHLE